MYVCTYINSVFSFDLLLMHDVYIRMYKCIGLSHCCAVLRQDKKHSKKIVAQHNTYVCNKYVTSYSEEDRDETQTASQNICK